MVNIEEPTGSIPPGDVAGDLLIDGTIEILNDLIVEGDTIETETTITDRIEVEDNNQVAQLILEGDSSPAFFSMEGNPLQNITVLRSGSDATTNKLDISNDVQVLNSNLEISSDLSTTDGTVLYNAGQDQIPQNRLENESVTVAGNTVTLGSSTIVDYVDLNDTGTSFPIPNADIANSSVDIAGNLVSLGGSTTVDYVDLNDTGASFPIPNSDLENSSLAVAGNLVSLGGGTTVDYVDLDDTGASFPIPNADIANSSVSVAGNTVNLGGSTTVQYVDLSDTATFPIPNKDIEESSLNLNTVGNINLSSTRVVNNFEDGTIGTFTGDVDSFTASTLNVISGSFSGNLTDGDRSDPTVSTTNLSTTDTLSFVTQFQDQDSSEIAQTSNQFNVIRGDGTQILSIRELYNDPSTVGDESALVLFNGSSTELKSSLAAGEESDVELAFDFANNEVDVTVDGTSEGTFALQNTASSAEEFEVSIVNAGSTATAVVDDIEVSSGGVNADTPLGSRVTLDASKDTATVTSNVLTNGQRTIFTDVSGGALTVTLSNADTIEGKEITVVDSTGNAGTNNITVDTEGTQTINGDTDAIINDNFEALTFQSDGTNFFITSRMPGGGTV